MKRGPCPRPWCVGTIELPPPGSNWGDERTCDRCGHVRVSRVETDPDLDALERIALLVRLADNMRRNGLWTARLEGEGEMFTVERTALTPGRIVEAKTNGT